MLQGSFAIAIFEHESQKLILARDGMGHEPLYVAHNQERGHVIFGSTLPMVARRDEVDTALDPLGLNLYSSYRGSVAPPFTILRDVKKIPPGSVSVFEGTGFPKSDIFWSPSFSRQSSYEGLNAADWANHLHALLHDLIAKRLNGDQPIVMSVHARNRLVLDHIDRPHSYALGMKGFADPHLEYLKKQWGEPVEHIELRPKDVFESLYSALSSMSEPAPHELSLYDFCALKNLGVENHLKIESFGLLEGLAYDRSYDALKGSNNSARDYGRVLFDRNYGEYSQSISPNYLDEDFAQSFICGHFAEPGADGALDQVLRFELTTRLSEGAMAWSAQYSRALGAQSYFPFMEPEMINLLGAMPEDLKGNTGAVHDILFPAKEEKIQSAPYLSVTKFLNGALVNLLRDVFNNRSAQDRQIFRPEYIANLLDRPEENLTPTGGSKLMQAAILEMWLQSHGL
jgi:asparagine synthase (glutamine-hydrolysing)